MKLNCGLTPTELLEEADAFVADHRVWEYVYAWWPRHVGKRDCRWLEVIQRRAKYWRFGMGIRYWVPVWEYRAK